MGNVIQFKPKPCEYKHFKYKATVEVFKCTHCDATDSFRLHVDGDVLCTACNIWQPLAVFEPNVKPES